MFTLRLPLTVFIFSVKLSSFFLLASKAKNYFALFSSMFSCFSRKHKRESQAVSVFRKRDSESLYSMDIQKLFEDRSLTLKRVYWHGTLIFNYGNLKQPSSHKRRKIQRV